MTVPHLNTWLTLLETSCAQVSAKCLDIIIDQSGSDVAWLPSVLSVEPQMPWHSLFSGLPEACHEELAPLLVRVDLAQPLQRHWLMGVMAELEGRSQLLTLASHWPFQLLAEHLGRCVEASSGGSLGVFRYYDPRLFPLLFSHALSAEQQQLWLRPALFWSWLDRDGVPQCLQGAHGTPQSDAFIPLELSDHQQDTLDCASDATLAMEKLNPALPCEWTAEQRFQACYAAMLEATEAGVLLNLERQAFALERLLKA